MGKIKNALISVSDKEKLKIVLKTLKKNKFSKFFSHLKIQASDKK